MCEQGRLHNGGNGARCTMAKIGGGLGYCDDNDAFARVYNNLLLHEYIYYFTVLHQCTFNLLFALFSSLCLKKHISDVFSCNSRKHCPENTEIYLFHVGLNVLC